MQLLHRHPKPAGAPGSEGSHCLPSTDSSIGDEEGATMQITGTLQAFGRGSAPGLVRWEVLGALSRRGTDPEWGRQQGLAVGTV